MPHSTEDDPQKIAALVAAKADLIADVDQSLMIATVGVAMALDQLRAALDKVQAHLDDREFEPASQVGYREVAHEFVYVQRTLAGLQTTLHQKEALISSIAETAHCAYETVAPYVEKQMQSIMKKSATGRGESGNE